MKQDIIEPKTDRNSHTLLYEEFFNRIRQLEYPLLDTMGHTYLDYTGGNLYAKSQLEKHHNLLTNNILEILIPPIRPLSCHRTWLQNPDRRLLNILMPKTISAYSRKMHQTP